MPPQLKSLDTVTSVSKPFVINQSLGVLMIQGLQKASRGVPVTVFLVTHLQAASSKDLIGLVCGMPMLASGPATLFLRAFFHVIV